MEVIKCSMEQLNELADFYGRVVDGLEAAVNYPKWTKAYPGRESTAAAIKRGEQYACYENGRVIGAVILNESPGGDYTVGDWKRELKEGEYLIIHTLAVAPELGKRGIGGFIVDECIRLARENGYKAVRIDVVPDNYPAIGLYERKGFSYAGTKDLKREIEYIPVFSLYELNFD